MILRNVTTGQVKTWTAGGLLAAVNAAGGSITHDHAVIGPEYWVAVRFPARRVRREPEGVGLAELCS